MRVLTALMVVAGLTLAAGSTFRWSWLPAQIGSFDTFTFGSILLMGAIVILVLAGLAEQRREPISMRREIRCPQCRWTGSRAAWRANRGCPQCRHRGYYIEYVGRPEEME